MAFEHFQRERSLFIFHRNDSRCPLNCICPNFTLCLSNNTAILPVVEDEMHDKPVSSERCGEAFWQAH